MSVIIWVIISSIRSIVIDELIKGLIFFSKGKEIAILGAKSAGKTTII
ncbi:MAG: hypothetical protein NZM09_05765 [Ignavibacterium sp.]|nr:hypothetical protein [Ignavibacterium sp.]MDW8375185.1 hypothetical protein [Ignavibacteriales bacterium]